MASEQPTSEELLKTLQDQVIPVLTGAYEAYKVMEAELAQARSLAEKGNAAQQENVALRQEIERLHLLLDPNKSGATALLAANREIERLHHIEWKLGRENAQARVLLDGALQRITEEWGGTGLEQDVFGASIRAFLAQGDNDGNS